MAWTLGKILMAALILLAACVLIYIVYSSNSGGDTGQGPEALTARYTLWLVVCTALLAVAGLAQSLFLFRAEDISRTTANAASKSAQIAERALIAGQRAFVSVSVISKWHKDHAGKIVSWSFSPVWANAGDTPTRNMRNHISLRLETSDLPADWNFPDLWSPQIFEADKTPVLLSLAPKATCHGATLGAVPINVIKEVIAGKQFLHLWGWATYNDVFPGTALHITRFAFKLRFAEPVESEKMVFETEFLNRYNCSDEECLAIGFPITP